MPAKRKVDYALLEPAWKAGVLSREQLADHYHSLTGTKVSGTAIEKYFKNKGIERSLLPKIAEATEGKVARLQAAQSKVADTTKKASPATFNNEKKPSKVAESTPKVSDREIVELVSTTAAEIVMSQRASLEKQAKVHDALLNELVDLNDPENREALVEIKNRLMQLTEGPDREAIQLATGKFFKAISLSSRIVDLKQLTEAHKNIVASQRQSFGLDDPENDPNRQHQPVRQIERVIVYANRPEQGSLPQAQIVDAAQDVEAKTLTHQPVREVERVIAKPRHARETQD